VSVGAGRMACMQLLTLVEASAQIASTRARSAKIATIAGVLGQTTPAEAQTVTAYLGGRLRQRRTGLGWASLRTRPAPAEQPTLSVQRVHETFDRIGALAGGGAQRARADALSELLAAATSAEQDFLVGLASGELRQGALEALVVEALAKATGLRLADVRRAVMLRGDLGPVAAAALADGADGLAAFGLEVGRPVQPMLARSAPDVSAALELTGRSAVEWKLDGIRVQLHRRDGRVQVFTRTLEEITERVPDVVEVVAALPGGDVVLDGEVLALRPGGRPQPFQLTASRTASRTDIQTALHRAPLTTYVFDILHRDGTDLLDAPGSERAEQLRAVVPELTRVPRLVTDDPTAAQEFFADAVAHGHEGVVVKALDAPWEAGRRGKGWIKVKPRHTLDLVVLAVEWGSGRRTGSLSNLHLGARAGEDFVMLGKTFKGLTDELLAWQTEHLLALADGPTDGYVVRVRPELVVEIAFDGVQTSTRYPGAVALRFARVLRYREDKTASEADTIEMVRALHPG